MKRLPDKYTPPSPQHLWREPASPARRAKIVQNILKAARERREAAHLLALKQAVLSDDHAPARLLLAPRKGEPIIAPGGIDRLAALILVCALGYYLIAYIYSALHSTLDPHLRALLAAITAQ